MTTRLSYKEREKGRREREILLSARHLIHESGYTGLNMDDLAEAVGISKPTLYQHFKSKEDLVVRVLVLAVGEVEEYLLANEQASPLQRLTEGLRLILSSRYGPNGLLNDFDAELITSTLFTNSDVVVAKNRVMAEARRLVEEGKASGEIIPTIPTPLVCCLLFKLLGLLSSAQGVLALDFHPPSDPEVLASLIDNIVAMFVRSIALEPAASSLPSSASPSR